LGLQKVRKNPETFARSFVIGQIIRSGNRPPKKRPSLFLKIPEKKGNKKASQRTNSQPQRTNIWPNGQVKSPNGQVCPLPVKHLRKKYGTYTKIRWIAFLFAFFGSAFFEL